MDNRTWMHPFDAKGERRHYKDIPKSVTDLVDDPFRSLAGELRRAGGFAKDTTPFSEFLWADFLRRRMKRKIGRARFRPRLEKALAIGQEQGRRLSARLVRPGAGGMMVRPAGRAQAAVKCA